MVETKHSTKLASMNYFQLWRTSIYIQRPTLLHLRICTIYLDSELHMDNSKELLITVDYQDKVYKFKECQDGLYYYDTVAYNYISYATDKSNAPTTDYSFLSTVYDNKSYFIRNEIEGSNHAIKVQQIIGCTSNSNFNYIIKKKLINNCNVTINDINHSKLIY